MSDRASRRSEGAFVVQGVVLVAEAAGCGLVEQVWLREGDEGLLGDLALPRSLEEAFVLDERTFDSVNDTATPQGILAVCRVPETTRIEAPGEDWIVVADGVSDPGNLGTIVRSAEAAGAAAVVVTRGTVDPWSPKTVRSSAGAVLHVPIVEADALADVSRAGYEVVGTTSHAGPHVESLWEAGFDGRIAVAVGNEARGLDPDSPVDRWVTVPHAGRSESLNVAMAATVVCLAVARARGAESSPSRGPVRY